MRNKVIVVFTTVLLAFLSLSVFSQNADSLKISNLENQLNKLEVKKDSIYNVIEDYKLNNIIYKLNKYGLPKIEQNEKIITHSAMILVYSEKHEQAKWVAHIILPEIKNGIVSRTNDFRIDSLIETGSAEEADYFIKQMQPDSTYKYDGFGYDRGHLAPSADFRWSKKALSESYYYSNMSPQVAELNRETWANLEDILRAYVINYNTELYVVTGGVLNDSLVKIARGKNKVSIPKYFYKVILDMKNGRAIAFLMPNQVIKDPVISHSKSIYEIEKLTGITFYNNLDKELQAKLKSQNNPKDWMVGKIKFDAAPLTNAELPKNSINTMQAYKYMNSKEKVTVCGTVSSTKKTKGGHVFINLDKSFPEQIFTITIWNSNLKNFSYQPEKYLITKKICVTGSVEQNKGTASLDVKNEKQIEIIE